ncbi:MAG TPA: NTP transferase domain-containing protein [Acidimicrobiales bacterium]|nr:NTP transferase domain-containing protein [Acidimicrobiales bacterium]
MTGAAAPSLVVLAAGLARRYGGGCKPLAPIGPRGEAVIDLLASDAVAAGFGRIVLVLHPETGPAVRYHVEHVWPDWVGTDFVTQRVPLGTMHAVLAGRSVVGATAPFAVANADDVYGEPAMSALSTALGADTGEHVLIGYRLRATVATPDPVTRGICDVDHAGHLRALTERRGVARLDGGARFATGDGGSPAELDGDVTTSVNLWGFRPAIWEVFDAAMKDSGLDEDAVVGHGSVDERPPTEVLLPEVVARAVSDEVGLPVRVVPTNARLIGVTHAADLPTVSADLARQVASGLRTPVTFEPSSGPSNRS